MEFVRQTLEEIVASLRPIAADWKDETAERAIETLCDLPPKEGYDTGDLRALLDQDFEIAVLVVRLFLGLSKDQFQALLGAAMEDQSTGVKSYRSDPDRFVDALVQLGTLGAMADEVNRELHWSDVLVERLRSGRGSAIAGQRRGRSVEDFAEAVVREVFGNRFESRCTFTGPKGMGAKCDFAVPSREDPRIVIESKGYGATGSKMTDVIGDIEKIIAAKRSDSALLFFTDGTSWKQRTSDLRKIVEYQNHGDITRIYTLAMAESFEADLRRLKQEYGIPA